MYVPAAIARIIIDKIYNYTFLDTETKNKIFSDGLVKLFGKVSCLPYQGKLQLGI